MMILKRNNKELSIIAIFCLVVFGLNAQTEMAGTQEVKQEFVKVTTQNGVTLTNTTEINTDKLEFSPAFYQNGIVFTTTRRTVGPQDNNIGETFFELFYSDLDSEGMPLKPETFGVEMNTEVHEGPVSFSRDGNLIFLTRNNYTKGLKKAGSDGWVQMQIYEAKRGFFDWENVKEVPFNNDEYNVMHPSLSPDGTKLYFTSNMPGGHGETDIYVVSRNGDIWGTPENLGPSVNTAGKEAFPFIHESGTLFFASNGHPGMGGFDIFKTQTTGNAYSAVTSMGVPFNTEADDFGLILNQEGKTGYFTSARAGGKGTDDIYKFDLTGESIETPMMLSSIIRVYDEGTKERIKDAGIRVFERDKDGFASGGEYYDAVFMPDGSGSNELVLKLVRKNASELGKPEFLTDLNGESPYELKMNKEYIILVTKDGYTSNEMVYSSTGKSGEVIIEVPLGVQRCANLQGKTTNKNTGSVIPNATVKIFSTCGGEEITLRSDASGNFNSCLPTGCNYTFLGEKSGYSSSSSKLSVAKSNTRDLTTNVGLTPIPTAVTSTPVAPVYGAGTVIVLDKIYYDFNKSAIRTGAARELDALYNLMLSYPSMAIELGSHTDSRGSSSYNQTLSQRRAESAKRYLTTRGIASSRITAVGFGESQPRNQCADGTNCSEEEHQYNRRTEVRVKQIDQNIQVQYGDRGPEVIDRMNNRR